jgi:hypothetical protein
MTRLLLASIGLAVLQLGTPRPASPAELGPSGESLRAVPASEAPSDGTLTVASPRSDRVRPAGAPPLAPAASHWPDFSPTGERGPEAPAASPAASAPSLLPLPRAPPA